MISVFRASALLFCLGVAATTASAMPDQSTPPQQITIVDTATGHTANGYTGTFTASGLVCPSGTWADNETTVAISTEHTCGDGSGVFESKLYASVGMWTLTGGTGRYATLRGHGPQCQLDEGPPVVRTCQLLAAFDDVASSATITRFTASSSAHRHAYLVKISFVAKDDVAGNTVAFKLVVRAGSRSLARRGTTSGQTESFALVLKAPKAARQLTMTLTLVDPVGNTRTIVRRERLPGRR